MAESKAALAKTTMILAALTCVALAIAMFLDVGLAYAPIQRSMDENGNVVDWYESNGDRFETVYTNDGVIERRISNGEVIEETAYTKSEWEKLKAKKKELEQETGAEKKAERIEKLISELPADAGYKDREAIEKARQMYDDSESNAKEKVSYAALEKLREAEQRAANPTIADRVGEMSSSPSIVAYILAIAWLIFFYVQAFLAYGSAYRKTKAGGDSGVSLFGWMLAYGLAAFVPGLGIYLWHRSKKTDAAG